MGDALDKLISQTSISMALDTLKPYHGVVTVDGRAQARQQLLGTFKMLSPGLLASRLYAYDGDELTNPTDVHELLGEFRMYFLREEAFSTADRAGMLEIIEPQEDGFPAKHWLSLQLFLPEQFFPHLLDTKMISCTVTGLHVQRPLPEVGSIVYHWRSAARHRLTVADAHFSTSLPSHEQ